MNFPEAEKKSCHCRRSCHESQNPVLDEPTAGLDPKERVRFREMIARQGENNIVLLSTHIVSDVEQIADKILMMKEGQLIFEGTRQETGSDLEKLYLEKFGEVKGCE